MATVDVIANRSTASEILGKAYFETDTNSFIVYNGIGWVELQSDGTGSADLQNRLAASFDGTDDYLDIDGIASSIDSYTNVSWSGWYKGTDTAGYIFRASPSGSANPHIGMSISSNSLFGVVTSNDAGNANNVTHQTTINDGSWHHLAVTFNGTSGDIKVYVDGVVNSTTPNKQGNPSIGTGYTAANIGRRPTSSHLYTAGLIDEFAIFNSELSASDVTSIYNGGVPGNLSSLNPVGWWRMGDDSNDSGTAGGSLTTITDSSGNGNDATQSTASAQPTFKALDASTTSLSYDGVNDYIQTTGLSLSGATSFSMWFNAQASVTNYPLLHMDTNGVFIDIASSNLRCILYDNAAGDGSQIYKVNGATGGISVGTWFHLAVTTNGTSTLKLYVNGVEQGAGTPQSYGSSWSSFNAPSSLPLEIGARTSYSTYAQQLIDEVAIFNSELSASEVASLAASRGAHIVNELSLSPTVYYRMGEDDSLTGGASVSQITDASGNGNHATQSTAANQPTASVSPVIYV